MHFRWSSSGAIVPMAGLALLVACGGSGGDSGGPRDAGRPDASTAAPERPVLSLDRIPTSDAAALIAMTQPGATVEVVALTATELWHVDLDSGAAESVLTLASPRVGAPPPPSAVRASDGSIHVAWEGTPAVHYATNAGGTWTESEVSSSGREVSIALDAADVPHVAFIRLADEATVARPEGDSWALTVVGSAPGGLGLPWTAIANQGGRLFVVGTTGDGSYWLKAEDGTGWVDDSIDVGDVIFMERSGEQTFTAGPGGILLTFRSNGRYAAFRPSGAGAFRTATLGAQYELDLDEPLGTAVGAREPFIAAQDFGERLVVVANGDPYWPLVAAVPWRDCGGNVALSLDGDDRPIVATWCEGELVVLRAVGTYPPDFDARCDEVVAALCDRACACGTPDDECGFFVGGSTDSGNRWGCELAARETLCSDSTEPFATLVACLGAFDTPQDCDATNGYPVPETCWPLRAP